MSKWISVKDRLPDVDERVIVFGVGKIDGFIGDTMMAITSMSDKNPLWPSLECEKHWRSPWQYFLTDYEITHWMPLPSPPKCCWFYQKSCWCMKFNKPCYMTKACDNYSTELPKE